jgi:hypothetical protein
MFHTRENSILKFNLDQGKDILTYNDDMDKIVSPHLKLIQTSTLIEGLNGANMSYNDKKALEGLQNIENQFNQTLALYAQTYKQLNEDILTKRQSSEKIVDYLGKVVADTDGNNYYVNNFGFTHKYSPNAWENNNSSCPSTSVSYGGSMNDFQTTLPMVQGQPCKIAGQNIKNQDTKEEAWVDIKGVKHPYSNLEKNASCSSQSIEMSSRDYNLIPSGSAMSRTDSCMALDVNPQVWSRLQQINTQLKNQAVKLTAEINKLALEDNESKQQLMNKRQQLLSYIDTIDNDRNDITSNNNILMQVVGEETDSSLRMTSNYYSYIIWIFIMIFIISLTVAVSTNDDDKVSGISYVIIAIFVLMFLIYLYKKLSNNMINY